VRMIDLISYLVSVFICQIKRYSFQKGDWGDISMYTGKQFMRRFLSYIFLLNYVPVGQGHLSLKGLH